MRFSFLIKCTGDLREVRCLGLLRIIEEIVEERRTRNLNVQREVPTQIDEKISMGLQVVYGSFRRLTDGCDEIDAGRRYENQAILSVSGVSPGRM